VAPQAGQFPVEQINFAEVAQTTFDELSDQEKAAIPERGPLPHEIDRLLLRAGRAAARRSLEDREKRQLRDELRRVARNFFLRLE